MIKIVSAAALFALLSFISTRAVAQNHEVSLFAATGVSGLHYTSRSATSSLRPGFRAGIGYTSFFAPRWGLSAGFAIGRYQTKARVDSNAVFSSYQVDDEGNAFEYRVQTKSYNEVQSLYALNVPVQLQFQTQFKRRTQFYSLAGVTLSVPLSTRYKAHANEVSATGYYPDLNVEIDDLPVHGFGTQTGWNKEGAYALKLACGVTAEAGAKFCLSSGSYLYAGAYIDYGLNSLKKKQDNASLLTYDPGGLSRSQATGMFSPANATGNVHLLSYGIKLRIAFPATKAKKEVTLPALEASQPVQTQVVVQKVVKPQSKPLADSVEKIASPQRGKLVAHPLTPAEETVLKTPVSFGRVGDTTLSAASVAQADSIAQLMQRHSEIKVLIEGHTCDLGTDAVNSWVGLARARAVMSYLQQKGIEASRMQTLSKGAAEPLVPNTSELNRRQNRRVVIKVTDQ